eukprot:gene2142-17729_t
MAHEESLGDTLMRCGLWLGAVFQMICILAVIFIPSKKVHELEEHHAEYSIAEKPKQKEVRQKTKGMRKRR